MYSYTHRVYLPIFIFTKWGKERRKNYEDKGSPDNPRTQYSLRTNKIWLLSPHYSFAPCTIPPWQVIYLTSVCRWLNHRICWILCEEVQGQLIKESPFHCSDRQREAVLKRESSSKWIAIFSMYFRPGQFCLHCKWNRIVPRPPYSRIKQITLLILRNRYSAQVILPVYETSSLLTFKRSHAAARTHPNRTVRHPTG